jgi:lysine-N-methylase
MATLLLDAEQRFTCRSCGRCCRRGWDIALTAGEAAAYTKAGVGRWFREREDAAEGTTAAPFEPVPGHVGYLRIRKRPDGACGFLSADNRCRLHEELGAARKPLTCRLFPFRFHPAEGPTVVTASFSCPTVVANLGEPLPAQTSELSALKKAWSREHDERAPDGLLYTKGRSLAGASLGALRRVLSEMLERVGEHGRVDLQANAARMAAYLEDLSRHRVVRLPDAAFAEYLELTGTHAARTERPVTRRPPSRPSSLFFRGFLFTVAAARLQLEDGRTSGPRLGLRLRLAATLAHCHGLWPATCGVDLKAARRARVDLAAPEVHPVVRNYIRAQIATLGTGRRPVVDEIGIAFALLDAALLLAAMRSAQAGRTAASAADVSEGLMEASDLAHAGEEGVLGSMLATLAGGVDALWRFSAPR